MRSYGQYCATARALDVVGNRWSLLIVRELLLRDCRFTDLRRGLPGVATNLLTERLRTLEQADVLERFEAPAPVASTLYRLTDRGRALAPVLGELTYWGVPEMVRGPQADAALGHWVAGAAPILFRGAAVADLAPLTVAIAAGGEEVVLEVRRRGGLSARLGTASDPDARVRGDTQAVMEMLAGARPDLEGLEVTGDVAAVRELASRSCALISAQRRCAAQSALAV